MSSQPTMNIQQHVKTLDAKSGDLLKREILLDALRAAKWVIYLEELLAVNASRIAVEQFYADLNDACWLARWKREDIIIEVAIASIPELISQLIPTHSETVTASVLEDILASLTR